jgi:hypothetical protein
MVITARPRLQYMSKRYLMPARPVFAPRDRDQRLARRKQRLYEECGIGLTFALFSVDCACSVATTRFSSFL